MTLTTLKKPTDDMFFCKYNATELNRQVRIRFIEKNEDGTYKKGRLLSARQLFELLGEKRTADVIARFSRFMEDGDFQRSFRKLGRVEFNWR